MIIVFFVIFMIAFGGAGAGVIVAGSLNGEVGLIVFGAVFFLVGMGFVVPIILHIKRYRRIREVVKNGTAGIGYFESQFTSVVVNGVPKIKIRFSFTDEFGAPHVVKTLKTYSQQEASTLASMGQFKILHYKTWAVIDEDLRNLSRAAMANMNNQFGTNGGFDQFGNPLNNGFNQNQFNQFGQSNQFNGMQQQMPQPQVVQCRYCNSKISTANPRCRNCGAGLQSN